MAEDTLVDEIEALLTAGKKIEAIKLYREATGADLKAAKEAVEELAVKKGIAVSRSGCLSALVALAFLAYFLGSL